MKRFLVLVMLAITASCGTVYVAPQVQPGLVAQSAVAVIPMTPASIAAANAVPFAPEQLPGLPGASSARSGAEPVLPRGVTDLPPRTSTLPAKLPPPLPPEPYRLGPGDVLLLRGKEPAAADPLRLTISGAGTVAIPGIRRVAVAGRTLEEAEEDIFRQFLTSGVEPAFALDLIEYRSRSATISGAVRTPLQLPLGPAPIFLEDALAAAGGPQEGAADGAVVRLLRGGVLYRIPLVQLFTAPSARKYFLTDGDSIFLDRGPDLERAQAWFGEQVRLAELKRSSRLDQLRRIELELSIEREAREASFAAFQARRELGAESAGYAYLSGEVLRNGRFALPYETRASLADALFDAGGLQSATGNPAHIYVLRIGAQGKITAWHLDARNAAAMVLTTRMYLRPDDVIFVAQQPITVWNRAIRQILPTVFQAAGAL